MNKFEEALKEVEAIINPSIIIDVGANVGEYSLVCRETFPDAKIYAFEPLFEKKIDGVKWLKIGLGNKTGEFDFWENKNNSKRSSIFEPNKKILKKLLGKREIYDLIKIPVKRFDSLGIKIKGPCFLKIDVEGYDYEVLEGFGDLLDKIYAVQIEYYRKKVYDIPDKEKVLEYLKKRGFVLKKVIRKHKIKRIFTVIEERIYVRKGTEK